MGKTVVIVGAGITGATTANSIRKQLGANDSVKLITISDYITFFPATIRVPFSKKFDAIAPLKELVHKDVEIVSGPVTSFDETSVTLESGETITFDVLVIATGSKWPSPVGTAAVFGNDHEGHYKAQGEKIKAAKDIVLIGGGFVNVEFAGELYHVYKKEIDSGEKRLSIIHNSDKLLPDSPLYSDKLRNKVTQWFEEKKINLYLNSKGEQTSQENQVIINGSKIIEADLVYFGIGAQPVVPKNEIPEFTNGKGFIRTAKNFQVKAVSKGNIFAIGDVTDFQYHGLIKLSNWVPTITSNIIAFLQDGSNAKLKDSSTYENENIPSIVSLGPNDGAGQVPLPWFGTVTMPRFVITNAKSKDLFIGKWRKIVSG